VDIDVKLRLRNDFAKRDTRPRGDGLGLSQDSACR
jgi:hypothetical protein